MTIHLMHGSHFAKTFVNNYLAYDMPQRLVTYRNGWGLDDESLPTPVKFVTYEPLAMDEWPTIITVAISASYFDRLGFIGSDPEYRVAYNMRTYVWVRTEGSEETTLMRDRLSAVLRSSLLDYPSMKFTDPRSTFKAEIEQTSISEEYSDLTLLKGDRVLAGAYLGYTIYMNEIVSRADIATLEQIDLTVNMSGLSEELNP
jgi:hypothetical protein